MADFTLAVEASLVWTLFFHDQRLEADSCPTLTNTPPIMKSPANVVNLIIAVEGSMVCIGNTDKSLPLVKFMDATGKL